MVSLDEISTEGIIQTQKAYTYLAQFDQSKEI